MNTLFWRVPVLILFCTALVTADSDTRSVQAEFDRCRLVIDRLERTLRRYEDAVARIIRIVKLPTHAGDNRLRQEAASLENRLEYFRNRFERARGQADKIRGDLKNVSGPTCPSCVTSSVNMYCRNGETLQNSLDEYIIRADDLLNSMNDTPSETDALNFTTHRSRIDSLHQSLGACSAPSALPLIEQAQVNLQRADSLFSAGNESEARKALSIAGTLAEKAAERCNDR